MKSIKNLDVRADEMQGQVFDRMETILKNKIGELDNETLNAELSIINTAGRLINNHRMMKRIEQGQMIRVVSFITNDEVERRKYIEATMPQVTLALH